MQRVCSLPARSDLHRQEAAALALLNDSLRPFGVGETLDQFVRRPFQWLAANELRMSTGLQRRCREIETSTFSLSPDASARFRHDLLEAVKEWQGRSR
jgi:hypothetical protein